MWRTNASERIERARLESTDREPITICFHEDMDIGNLNSIEPGDYLETETKKYGERTELVIENEEWENEEILRREGVNIPENLTEVRHITTIFETREGVVRTDYFTRQRIRKFGERKDTKTIPRRVWE